MKLISIRNIYLLVTVPILLVLLFCELILFRENSHEKEVARISRVFEGKERQLHLLIDSVSTHLTVNPRILSDWSLVHFFQNHEDGLEMAVFGEKGLMFWSSSSIAFPATENSFKKSKGLIHLPTGWYYQVVERSGIYTIEGFILIKREFPYHNRYIKSSFDHDFKLPDDYQVQMTPQAEALNIARPDGTPLFSIVVNKSSPRFSGHSNLTVFLFFSFILLLIIQLSVWLKHSTKLSSGFKLIVSFFACLLVYWLVCQLRVPAFLFKSNLFSPDFFAFNRCLSSLGEFVLLSILMFQCSYSFFMVQDVPKEQNKGFLRIILSFIFAAFYFSFTVVLFKILLLNSNISLEFFSDLKFSVINVYAFIGISLQVFGFIMIIWRLRKDFFRELGGLKFVLGLLFTGMIPASAISAYCHEIDWVPFAFYALSVAIIAKVEIGKIREFKFTFLLLISIAGAGYVNLFAHELIQGKKSKISELWAVKLSSERDSGAEIFLSELDNKIRKDTIIQSHLKPPYKTLETYFQNTYFTGFWRNYNLQITVCSPNDSVYITDEKRHYPCVDFFNNLRETKGLPMSGSNFYFMDRVNGRISYLGQLDFVNSLNIPVKIYIELNSKVIPEGKGYPELLLDEHSSRESQEGDFSYAKYFDGELVDRGGDYQYSVKLPLDVPMNEEYTHYSKNGFAHCAYNPDGNNYVIASYPEVHIYDKISTFPYLFLLFFLLGSLFLLFTEKNLFNRGRRLDFREKIQLTLILSLLGILIIIGLGLMLYNSNKLLISVKDNLNDKLTSVTTELSIRIGQENQLSVQMLDFINEQLVILSDIIRADINLYDLNGSLLATSRSEIFDRGLMSRRIDPEAFKAISVEQKNLFLHDESLGEMNFFSAYAPIYNQNNRLIGYLNMPYFTGHDDFEKQVSDFIVAFSNLYILLIIISLVVALLISHKLTAPLLQIENYLKGIQLGKTNAKIEYSGEDEIGRLANEYNKKVDELAESAELLARSERESAWQEMARQVAHEINNPLTPMKLSIQYLQRIKEQKSENFDEYFRRVSKTLVEQIDALSLIASSFSDFAKMPKNNDELIDLNEKLREVMLLFENMSNVEVSFHVLSDGPIRVMADKDQLGRAIINLVKNGIQAIPRERKGTIMVKLYKDEAWAYISITDNGVGIPVDLQDKLFEPSFTTKSSGMGLGLAIAKKIIENFKGDIWFQSIRDVETVFYIKLPLANPI